jgi:hypothetical protein
VTLTYGSYLWIYDHDAPWLCFHVGTYNDVTGQDEASDCSPTPAGFYSVAASVIPSGSCAAGYYCPVMSTTATQVACPLRYFLNRTQGRSQDDCVVCPAGHFCTIASTEPKICPRGYINIMRMRENINISIHTRVTTFLTVIMDSTIYDFC